MHRRLPKPWQKSYYIFRNNSEGFLKMTLDWIIRRPDTKIVVRRGGSRTAATSKM